MKYLFFILIMALVVSPANSQETPGQIQDVDQDDLGIVSDEFQEYFFEALKQKGIENYEKAIVALEKCLKLGNNEAIVYFELGKNYLKLGQPSVAVSNFQKAHELQPEKESILIHLLDTYKSVKDYNKAIEVVQKLISFDVSYEEDLANMYFLGQDYENSLKVLDRLDAKYGENSYRSSLRRQIYARTNNTTAQIDGLEKSIDKDPDIEQNYLNLIYLYSEEGREEEAYRVANELLEAFPGSSLAHLALYKFQLNKGEPEAAINSMKIVFKSEEIDSESKFKVLNDFLNFVQENPEYDKELIEITEVLSKRENAPQIYEQLGLFYLERNNREDALTFFELGIMESPDNFELIKNTLALQLELQELDAASLLSLEALEIFPSQPVFYLFQAVALNKLQKFEAAEKSLQNGIDYLIDDIGMEIDFYLQMAISHTGMNNVEKAKEFRLKAEKLQKEIN